MEAPIAGGVVGVPEDFSSRAANEEVKAIVTAALGVFEELGATVEPVKLPDCHEAYRAANVTFSEVLDIHQEAVADDPKAFSEPFKTRFGAMRRYTRRTTPGRSASARNSPGAWKRSFERVDVLAMPTATVAAAPIAGQPPDHDRQRRKNACIFDFTGQPSISVPCGFTADGVARGADDLRRTIPRRPGAALRPRLRAGHALA